jgi:hypothetical protein
MLIERAYSPTDHENASARRRHPSFLTVEWLARVQVRVLGMTLPYVARSTTSLPPLPRLAATARC